VTPLAGRTFLPSDTPNDVVVVSEGFWRRRYGADPSLVGRSMAIAGHPRTVIGIVPDRFHVVPATVSNAGSEPPQLWMLFNAPIGGGPAMRRAHFLYAIGRLKADVSMEAAQQELTAIGAQNATLFPETNQGHDPTMRPLRDSLVGAEMRVTSLLLLGVVAFVLLMCCANMANLFLARTNARARELAVRSALGATRGRILTLICAEAVLIGLVGGIIGMLIGHALGAVASAYLNNSIGQGFNWYTPRLTEWLYLLIVTVISLLAGLVPALKAYRTPVATNLVAA